MLDCSLLLKGVSNCSMVCAQGALWYLCQSSSTQEATWLVKLTIYAIQGEEHSTTCEWSSGNPVLYVMHVVQSMLLLSFVCQRITYLYINYNKVLQSALLICSVCIYLLFPLWCKCFEIQNLKIDKVSPLALLKKLKSSLCSIWHSLPLR